MKQKDARSKLHGWKTVRARLSVSELQNNLTKNRHRNAAKARIKDTIGRLEKTFFGQRRLCAPSKGLLAPKPMQISSISLEGSLERADISLEHAKRRIPPKNDVITSSFVSRPEHINPSTPYSRRQTKRRVEAQPSSSNVSRSKVLDALDVSERQLTFGSRYMRLLIQLHPTAIFLRGVLDRILTIPDLAGISKNRTKPTGRQRQASDESSPLQRTKRKVKPNFSAVNAKVNSFSSLTAISVRLV